MTSDKIFGEPGDGTKIQTLGGAFKSIPISPGNADYSIIFRPVG